MVSDGEASQIRPAVQGMHLSAAGRAARILTGERLQDLYRVGRRRGLHARVRGGSLRHPTRAGDRFQRETALRFERQPGFARKAAGAQQLWRSEVKALNIGPHIGRRPLLAFGNSDGDLAMVRYTKSGSVPRLALLLHHDDAAREAAYDREFRLSPLSEALDKAQDYGITVVSMKQDWNVVF